MKKFINKGSVGCALGVATMCAATVLAAVIFIKCFANANNADYNLNQYIAALFSRHALTWYLGVGVLFTAGLWLAVNAIITIFKDFFEV